MWVIRVATLLAIIAGVAWLGLSTDEDAIAKIDAYLATMAR
jgi:hypothetical protein